VSVAPDAARVVSLDAPLDVRRTFGPLTRGRQDRSAQFDADGFWRAANTPCGPATVHVRLEARSSAALVAAWGPGAAWAIDRANALVGADDVDDLDTDHPAVLAARRAAPGLRMTATGAASDVALATVVDQRVTSVEAKRTWSALVRSHGSPAPGPRSLRVPPTAEVIATLTDDDRRRVGLEARRGAALIAVARSADRLQRAADRGSPALQRMLVELPGVGPWTAATVAQLVCGDADAVIVGDWHLPRQVGHALAGDPRADDARMLELLEPFRPHRARVVRLLLAAGAGPKRTAPRAEIPDLVRREHRGERDYRVRRTLRFERD
jgi:3-methyladenine DNA glycosylase/8-oxoguanine DNA glycosylase